MCTDRVYAGTRGGEQNGSPQYHSLRNKIPIRSTIPVPTLLSERKGTVGTGMVLMVMGTVRYHTFGNLGLGKDKYVEVRNFFKSIYTL